MNGARGENSQINLHRAAESWAMRRHQAPHCPLHSQEGAEYVLHPVPEDGQRRGPPRREGEPSHLQGVLQTAHQAELLIHLDRRDFIQPPNLQILLLGPEAELRPRLRVPLRVRLFRHLRHD